MDGVEIRLEAGAWVHGIVSGLDADEMRAATVSLGSWSTRIDASGHFSLGPIPSGSWDVVADAGPRRAQDRVLVEPGQADAFVELAFPTSYLLSGRVLDPEGRPAAGADLDLHLIGEEGPTAATRTRPNGTFALSAPAGEYTLHITAEPWAQQLPLRIADTPRTDLEIRLAPGTTLHGRVLGTTTEEATLEVALTSSSDWHFAELLPDGTWKARGIPPGLWTIRAVRSLRHGFQMIGPQVQIPPGLSDMTLDLDFTEVPVLTGEEEP